MRESVLHSNDATRPSQYLVLRWSLGYWQAANAKHGM